MDSTVKPFCIRNNLLVGKVEVELPKAQVPANHFIAKQLMSRGYKSPVHDKWYQETVNSIRTNKKYKGDAFLQKSNTVDFLQKKRKKNSTPYLTEDEIKALFIKAVNQG